MKAARCFNLPSHHSMELPAFTSQVEMVREVRSDLTEGEVENLAPLVRWFWRVGGTGNASRLWVFIMQLPHFGHGI